MDILNTAALQDHRAYLAALDVAKRRAATSYFDQHVLKDGEGRYVSIDEGDYGTLPMHLIERIVQTVAGELIDEF